MPTPSYRARRPAPSEYNPSLEQEVVLVPDGDVVDIMAEQGHDTIRLLLSVPESRLLYRYAEGKWSMKEVVGHIMDAERIFIYRATCIARGERASLPGFDEAEYVREARFDAVPLQNLFAEFKALRNSSVEFFRNLDQESWDKRGTANGNPITVRALAYVVAGHELHHRKLLRERYLKAENG